MTSYITAANTPPPEMHTTDPSDSSTVSFNDDRPPPKKRPRASLFNSDDDEDPPVVRMDNDVCDPEVDPRSAAITADAAESVRKDVAPFLSKHIPRQYAPQGHPDRQNRHQQVPSEKGNTRYCYRHRPDLKCRRAADEPTMDQLQSNMENLPGADQQAISHVWSLFSAAPASMRKMMLQGILQQCCFPQLSFISTSLRELIRIDFLTALPPELSFRILSYLDTTSLCKAAQVSRTWRILADDDVVWHNMCEQHINRKCDKCGWGLPLLDRQRLRASKRQMQLRKKQPPIFTPTGEITDGTNRLNIHGKRPQSDPSPVLEEAPASPAKRPCPDERRTRPWKDVYSERYKVESNWRRGRCTERIFKGHTDGIMALQFDDSILVTGSYDSTIKIWDIETGEELRTLRGHTSGVRALQFDDTKLVSGSLDNTVKVWDYHEGRCVNTLRAHTKGVLSVHFDASPKNVIASGSVDKTIVVWDFEISRRVILKGHEDWVNCVKIDTESRTLFSASDDHTVKMWDLDTRSCIRTFEGHVGPVQQVLLEPDMLEYLPPPAENGDSSPDRNSLMSYRDPPTPPSSQRISHPNTLITASLDNQIKLWDVKTGKCLRTLFGHVEGVWAVAADQFRIVTGAQDRMVKVWDVKTGKCQRTITGPTAPVTCVGLSDSRMVTGGEDMIARMYCFKAVERARSGVIGEEGDGRVVGEEDDGSG